MTPVLTLVLALLSDATALAKRVVEAPPQLAGAASVSFYFQNRHEEATFDLLDQTGAVRPEALAALSRFVRCWRTDRSRPLHPRLVEVVAALSRQFGDARIEVISGYRARPYGAKHSKHFVGRAMDVHLQGVPARKVAAWVWKNFRHVGVGYYPRQQFVHIDVRDLDVRWIDRSSHGESARARYFGRRAAEPLPETAPVIAYDRAQAQARAALALTDTLDARTLAAIH